MHAALGECSGRESALEHWKLVRCPECGAKCWRMPHAEYLEKQGQRTLHHVCLKKGVRNHEEDNKMEKCCGSCWHHRKQDGEWVCMNEHAENFALETEYRDGQSCDEWEKR